MYPGEFHFDQIIPHEVSAVFDDRVVYERDEANEHNQGANNDQENTQNRSPIPLHII